MMPDINFNAKNPTSGALFEASRIQPWEEWTSELRDLLEIDDYLIARGKKDAIILPLEMVADLKSHLGQRISILRTDRDYRFRILEMQNRDQELMKDIRARE